MFRKVMQQTEKVALMFSWKCKINRCEVITDLPSLLFISLIIPSQSGLSLKLSAFFTNISLISCGEWTTTNTRDARCMQMTSPNVLVCSIMSLPNSLHRPIENRWPTNGSPPGTAGGRLVYFGFIIYHKQIRKMMPTTKRFIASNNDILMKSETTKWYMFNNVTIGQILISINLFLLVDHQRCWALTMLHHFYVPPWWTIHNLSYKSLGFLGMEITMPGTENIWRSSRNNQKHWQKMQKAEYGNPMECSRYFNYY